MTQLIKLIQKKNNILIFLKKIIIPYSAIKIKAKVLPEYSILNPDTNSLSPSEKSKGVRFNSAKRETIHKKKILVKTIINTLNLQNKIILYDIIITTKLTIINAKLTS